MPWLASRGVSGLLIEWEDMLPYEGALKVIRSPRHYSVEEVGAILAAASAAKLEIVPLVQTFGHLEFVLKHERFASLREVPDDSAALAPMDVGSVVRACVRVQLLCRG